MILSKYSYSQWYSVENGSGGEISEIKFKNSNTGWYLVGQGTNIYKTTDGGYNWKALDMPNIDTMITSIYLIHIGDTLWLPIGSGNEKRIIKSVNGGNNWFQITINNSFKIEKLFAINGNLLYGTLGDYSGSIYRLIKSTDGGLNWNLIYSFALGELVNSYLFFINENTGYAQGYRTISKTTNGGYNWNVIYNDTVQMGVKYFLNENTGWMQRGMVLYKTTNGGINWIFNYSNSLISGISFYNNDNGFMYGTKQNVNPPYYRSYFWKTSDYGNNWQILDSTFRYYLGYGNIELTNENTFYLVANEPGVLLKSTNGGYNWLDLTRDSLNNGYITIDFANSNTGFTGGPNGILMQTTNGGENWFRNTNYRDVSLNGSIKKIQFTDDNTGWISAFNGLYKTINRGVNWNKIINSNNNYPVISSFINNNTGWFYTFENNYIIINKTTNSGLSYSPQFKTNNTINSDICFYDSLFGFAVFDNILFGPNLYRTTNGGENWESININGCFSTIYLLNRNVAFLCSDIFDLIKTTDGGNTWINMQTNHNGWLTVKFINDSIGFGSTYNGTRFYYTRNAGNNWIPFNLGSVNYLKSLYFDKSGKGFAVGQFGKIYKTTNYGGIPVNINSNSDILPRDYYLSQNYPNPFNSKTKIEFKIPNSSSRKTANREHVILKVFNIIGQEVAILVNGKKSPGNYEVNWDASLFPSGVYFYRIISENYCDTKKMILIK
ncbi:MAG: T9SS type A sorting domain-containing protein [Ignavibacteriae bacterium]|nr:T9SS type A sorting domain-containing protein [Ignavibacteriota bacterium]